MAEPIQAVSFNPAVSAVTGVDSDITSQVQAVTAKNVTPFQVMLDAAVSGLDSVSSVENKANAYIAQYAKGNVSMEEALMEVSKMTMAVEFASTVVNHTVTAFKEIQQTPV